jgi:hypothetical protein
MDNIVKQARNTYRFVPYKITQGANRIFYANTVEFVNLGTGTVIINDVFEIPSGASQSLEGLKNEVDITSYKIAFVAGFVNKLQVIAKEDAGSAAILEMALADGRKPAPNRKIQLKKFSQNLTDKYLLHRTNAVKAFVLKRSPIDF